MVMENTMLAGDEHSLSFGSFEDAHVPFQTRQDRLDRNAVMLAVAVMRYAEMDRLIQRGFLLRQ
jgi:hypothetical protein